jgi:hypothetical protein
VASLSTGSCHSDVSSAVSLHAQYGTINQNFLINDVTIHRVDKEDLSVQVVAIDLSILRDVPLYKW